MVRKNINKVLEEYIKQKCSGQASLSGAFSYFNWITKLIDIASDFNS